ncbi:MAG: ribonuclease III [Rhizobiaceae bacterium]
MALPSDPAEIGKRIGYRFTTSETLTRALTHSSADGEVRGNYERLEFLGDRVLGLVTAQILWKEFPDADEGELSRRLNLLVNAETCAAIADQIGLGDFISTGPEIKSLAGRKRQNIRSDVLESLIAAIYLDGGLEPATAFIERFWRPLIHKSGADRRDAKTELQEWAHRKAGVAPVYTTEGRTGPDHDPVFTIVATVRGFEPMRATGGSKREAEQAAATAILVREGVWQADDGA